jgi:hypothetical protein
MGTRKGVSLNCTLQFLNPVLYKPFVLFKKDKNGEELFKLKTSQISCILSCCYCLTILTVLAVFVPASVLSLLLWQW